MMGGGILGAFASLDLFFFYFFHELALVPTFIMIGLWGKGENKNLRHVPNHALPERGGAAGAAGIARRFICNCRRQTALSTWCG